MKRSSIAACSALALLCAAGPGMAQDAHPLRIGASVDAALTADDPAAPDDAYRFDDYRFQARAGQRLEAVLRAADFDAYLEIRAEGQDAPLAEDDDGLGEGTNARLRFTPEADGTYILRARTLSGLEGGDYSLSLRERPRPPRAPRPTAIRLGQTLDGSLGDRDPELEDGGRYDAFVFRAAAGERLVVTLESDAFDPVVRVGRMNGPDFEELAQNDDAPGGGLNSRLVFVAPDAGDYVIRATSLSEGEGAYVVGLEAAPPPPPSKPLAVGDEVEGTLDDDSGQNDDGQRADLYRFTGTAGQRIAVEMSSDDFDTYLALRRLSANSIRSEERR
ncbi:PPC domain-containing protein, partial [Brevundimonas sp. UBA7534]|uniref:PPC domain-containing protein n=1 Tax=Brevundimonas sp. UBA7534 TaxID=1946138 RepID=UPI0025BC04DC